MDINYVKQQVYTKYILTHTDHDKNLWENAPYF
ncbi:hypothetical protein [Acaryochloris sp. IP29b_bin.137]|nr:hypothetical protein [Acaryochloris sp. IP29b_bin.137]